MLDYRRHILTLPLCPGRKFFLDAQRRLFSLTSPRGLRLWADAAATLARQGAARAALRVVVPPQGRHATKPLRSEREAIRRILWIRLDHIGDLALSLPALHALRENFPDARIDALTLPSSAPLLADVPGVSEVLTYDAPAFARDKKTAAGAGETQSLMRRLRARRYDLAVDTRGDDTSRLLAYFGGARRRAGPERAFYESPGKPNYAFLLTHPVPMADAPAQAADANLFLLRSLGLTVPEAPPYRLSPSPARAAAVRESLAALGVVGPYAVLHARPSEGSKAWNSEGFAAVANHLARAHGLSVLLSGAPADGEENARILAGITETARVFDIAGRFGLADLPALFQSARVMVTVDTGPMHIGAMVGTPLVALFLPGLADLYYPYRQPGSVLAPAPDAARFWRGGFLDALPAESVMRAVDQTLGG